ncbi:hypothetical protein CAPTEDRAFT_193503, partial [Capitella teleta]
EDVRSQDTVFVIAGVTGSRLGRDLAWGFLKERWTELHDRYKGGFLLSRLIKSTTEKFISDEKATEIEEFFKSHPAPAADRTIRQSLENIRLNKSQLERDGDGMRKYLTEL